MRKLVPLLACLMLVLVVWAGTAHATEAGGVETSVTQMAAHTPGDGDEVAADADKGYPHHHASCHEHHVDTPAVWTTATPLALASVAPPPIRSRVLSGHDADAHLRPPQA